MAAERHKHLAIVLVTVPFHGHITPMLGLATALHREGFSITIAYIQSDDPRVPQPSVDDYSDFTFTPLHCDASRLTNSSDFAALAWTMNEGLKAPLKNILTTEDVDCIVYDALLFSTAEVAQTIDLASIELHTSSAMTVFCFHHLSSFRSSYDPINLSGLVPGLEPIRSRDLFVHKTHDLDAFLDLITSLVQHKRSSAVIVNTADCIEAKEIERLSQIRPGAAIFPIGPMHRLPAEEPICYGDKSCLPWLDQQPHGSVIYVSLGSVVFLDRNEFVELAEGIISSEQRFLWVIRPGFIGGCDWTEALPEDFQNRVQQRGIIVKWAPQRELLTHAAIGGFLSHCGWNSTMESIAAGVPMICKPFFGDQWTNTRYVTHVWGTGLEMASESLKREEVEGAIRKIVAEEEGDEMRKRAKELRDKLEASVNKGGSSRNSFTHLVDFIKNI